MSEIITLSSEDEEDTKPVKKRAKLTSVLSEKDCIVLSDDQDSSPSVEACVISDAVKKDDQDGCASDDACAVTNGVASTSGEVSVVPNGAASVSVEDPIASDEVCAIPDVQEPSTSSATGHFNGETLSTSKPNPIDDELRAFLDCSLNSISLKYKEQVKKHFELVWKLYNRIKHTENISDIREVFIETTSISKLSTAQILLRITDLCNWLKLRYKSYRDEVNSNTENDRKIQKLDRCLLKIRRKIRVLEESEVNFDDESNSSYIQLCSYKERATKIFNKLCELRNENPNLGRLTYERMDFTKSDYPEINQAISKKYRSNTDFPTYFEMDKLIKKCAEVKQLGLTEEMLKSETRRCFEALGNLMQKRRKLELFQSHSDFLPNNFQDPANENPEIESALRTNKKEHFRKQDEIIEKYVNMQERGVEPNLSSDSGASNAEESDSDENVNDTTTVQSSCV